MNNRISYRDLLIGARFRVVSPKTETTKSGNVVKNDSVYVKEGNSHATDLKAKKSVVLPLGAVCVEV